MGSLSITICGTDQVPNQETVRVSQINQTSQNKLRVLCNGHDWVLAVRTAPCLSASPTSRVTELQWGRCVH